MIKFSPDQSIFDLHAYGRDAGTRRTLRRHKFFAGGAEVRFKMLALAGMLSLGLITATAVGTAEATWWRWLQEYSHNNNNHVSVPEPSSLYAFGTAFALLGGAAWFIRRK
jgi:hypothetical protein